jgi:hypothetical protein
MTQTARRKHIPEVTSFSEYSELPCVLPAEWMQCLSNRAFKVKVGFWFGLVFDSIYSAESRRQVIELVLTRLPSALLHGAEPGKTLVIDYHQPLRYVVGGDGALLPHTSLGHMRVLGEADVKFTRYADEYDHLLVDSIDGDSVPIALLHHELTLRKELCPPKVRFFDRVTLCVCHTPEKPVCVCVTP